MSLDEAASNRPRKTLNSCFDLFKIFSQKQVLHLTFAEGGASFVSANKKNRASLRIFGIGRYYKEMSTNVRPLKRVAKSAVKSCRGSSIVLGRLLVYEEV